MSETITFRVHVRVGSNGMTASMTQDEIDGGNTLSDVWNEDLDEVAFSDHVIEVTATLPVAPGDRVPAATVTLTAPPADGITAIEAG